MLTLVCQTDKKIQNKTFQTKSWNINLHMVDLFNKSLYK